MKVVTEATVPSLRCSKDKVNFNIRVLMDKISKKKRL